ncbi:MAG: hypothetical protein D6732_08435 [Methanobacteriota archaeon]|nr:MAG: hypothetical protein D6732_08435 [Euryarchaeota archaeon]
MSRESIGKSRLSVCFISLHSLISLSYIIMFYRHLNFVISCFPGFGLSKKTYEGHSEERSDEASLVFRI